MAEIEIKNAQGKVVGKHKVAEPIVALGAIENVLHRVIVAEQANARQGTHSAKTRSEAQGGGRKPYRQKKTGNARQGTIRAPHYAHGGMAFAIKPRDYSRKVNKKERRLATVSAFSVRLSDGDVQLADKIVFGEPKTKDAAQLLKAHGLDGVKRVLIVLAEDDATVVKSFRNMRNVEVRTAPTKEGRGSAFSTRDVLVAHKILMSRAALEKTEEAWSK